MSVWLFIYLNFMQKDYLTKKVEEVEKCYTFYSIVFQQQLKVKQFFLLIGLLIFKSKYLEINAFW